jgi:parallel beta-helix repeat protein
MVDNGISLTGNLLEHWNTHSIDSSNQVNGKPIEYWKNQTGGTLPPNVGQIIVANCTGVIIENQYTLLNCSVGISLGFSSNITIQNNTIENNQEAMWLWFSNNNIMCNNVINYNGFGLRVYNSNNNVIRNNTFQNNSYGVYFFAGSSINNVIYHNSFLSNNYQATDETNNAWHNGYPSGGNYWSDYTGIDNFYGPAQNIQGKDGIGDTNYSISGGTNVDNYPLMSPYTGQILGPDAAVPPYALTYAPSGTNIPINASIVINWNETMNWTSVESAFGYSDGVLNYTSANGTWLHSNATNTSTFTPAVRFKYDTKYWVAVNCSATDIVGNPLDQNKNGTGGEWPGDALAWNFTIMDAAPIVMSTSPANSQVDVDPMTTIKIVFSEPMNIASVNASFSYSNGTATWGASNGSVSWDVAHTTFIFTPHDYLQNNTAYIALLNGSIACDTGGKLLDGNNDSVPGDSYAWWFSIWLEPPPPHILNAYPPNGSANISINSHINLAFDCAMNVDSVESALSYSDGMNTWTGSDGSFEWFSGDSSLTFSPSPNFRYDVIYTVKLVSDLAVSLYGKSLDGNNNDFEEGSPIDDYSFSFTTCMEPPGVVSTYPAYGAVGISETLDVVLINFSKPMNEASVVSGLSFSPPINHSFSWTGNSENLTILLEAELSPNTQYTIRIASTATDLDGIKIDGNGDGVGGDTFVLVFTTMGGTTIDFPSILSVFPTINMTGVPTNTFVGIQFNKGMNRSSVEGAFSLKNATTDVNGTFSWNTDSTRLVFTPSNLLTNNTSYSVSLVQTALDSDGIHLNETFSWQFTTEAGAGPSLFEENWWLIAIIVAMLVIITAQFLKNRALNMNLRRARVELKRLKGGKMLEPERPESAPEALKVGAVQSNAPKETLKEIDKKPDT